MGWSSCPGPRSAGQWQVWGREGADYTARYPELEFLRQWPPGTLVDGELVQFQEGRSDLSAILRRHGLTRPPSIHRMARSHPVTYVLFDLLSLGLDSLCDQPLSVRREALSGLLDRYPHPRLVFSAGITGAGREFFQAAVAQGQEGIMAKHLASRYLPGRRCSAWRKIKPAEVIPCAIVGYRPARKGFRTLLVAAEIQGSLRYVAELSSGFSERGAGPTGSVAGCTGASPARRGLPGPGDLGHSRPLLPGPLLELDGEAAHARRFVRGPDQRSRHLASAAALDRAFLRTSLLACGLGAQASGLWRGLTNTLPRRRLLD